MGFFTRTRKRLSAVFFVALLLFAHGAMALESCFVAPLAETMHDCNESAPVETGLLCLTYSQAGTQTLDTAKTPVPQAPLLATPTSAYSCDVAPPTRSTRVYVSKPPGAPPPATILFSSLLV